jgi:RNA-directed DNA polymerase
MKKWYSLIDKVYRLENLERAYQAVKANNGAPGIDGVTVEAYGKDLKEELDHLHHQLKTGIYEPEPVLRVEIPKADGSKRPLGIPTVKDRVVQQALLNILQPIFDPNFHPSSYGYRPGRSCHQAVAKAEMFMNRYGLRHVVDMDLSKCFDRLDHELILKGVNRRISDGSLGLFLSLGINGYDQIIGRRFFVNSLSPQAACFQELLVMISSDDYLGTLYPFQLANDSGKAHQIHRIAEGILVNMSLDRHTNIAP